MLSKVTLVLAALGMMLGVQTANAFEIEWNGFGNIFAAKPLSGPKIYPWELQDNRLAIAPFSNLGLNIGAKLSDTLSVSGQFIASGGERTTYNTTSNWAVNNSFAFLNWRPGNGIGVKVGRQYFPIYLIAEYPNVGLLYPFRDMPIGVRDMTPFAQFEGASIEYTHDVGIGKVTGSIFGGRAGRQFFRNSVQFPTSIQVDVSNLLGATLGLNGNGYKLRTTIAKARASIGITSPNGVFDPSDVSGDVLFNTVSGSYDKHNIVLWSEFGVSRSNNGSSVKSIIACAPKITNNPLPGIGTVLCQNKTPGQGDFFAFGGPFGKLNTSGYVLGGYRIGAFLPRYMISTARWQDGVHNGSVLSHNIGVNYQLMPQAVIKIDYQLDTNPDSHNGQPPIPENPSGLSGETKAATFFAGIDFVF